MKFTALLFYMILRVRRKETLLRSPRVSLEIFTSLENVNNIFINIICVVIIFSENVI